LTILAVAVINNKSQLQQCDPGDALHNAHRAVHKTGRCVW